MAIFDRKRKGYKPSDLSVEKTKDFIIIPSPWLGDMGSI